MKKFLACIAEGAKKIEKKNGFEENEILNSMIEFGGNGLRYQIQTDKDNWTGHELPHGTLANDEYGRRRESFLYNNQLHYFIEQN